MYIDISICMHVRMYSSKASSTRVLKPHSYVLLPLLCLQFLSLSPSPPLVKRVVKRVVQQVIQRGVNSPVSPSIHMYIYIYTYVYMHTSLTVS